MLILPRLYQIATLNLNNMYYFDKLLKLLINKLTKKLKFLTHRPISYISGGCMEYMVTFSNWNNQICSYIIEAEDMAQALQVARILAVGKAVTVVKVV